MRAYDPRIAKFLEEIATTPTGWPLVDMVRLHWPRISYGQPLTGGALAYPWPIDWIIMRDVGSVEWQRETLAHELGHMMRWRGHFVASLEQEYDANLTAARVRCEWNGWNWTKPDEEAVRHYPLLFGPDADKDEFKRRLRERLPLYAILPWEQPRGPIPILVAMLQQGWFFTKQIAVMAKNQLRLWLPSAKE
jgi:hypothetical protein